MKKNIISKALAGSLLVATTMSANATTETFTLTFDVLPAITILPVTAFAPGAILTGTALSTCTWEPTYLNATAVGAPAVADVNVKRSGNGCPTQPITAGDATTTGVYTISGGATALNIDVNVTLVSGSSTNITFAPAGVVTPDDMSYPFVTLAADTLGTVNTGGTGDIALYLGGTTTIGATDITIGEDVDFDVIAIY